MNINTTTTHHDATESLPAVLVRMDGSIAVISNLDLFGVKLREFVSKIDRNPSTDQAFANAEAPPWPKRPRPCPLCRCGWMAP